MKLFLQQNRFIKEPVISKQNQSKSGNPSRSGFPSEEVFFFFFFDWGEARGESTYKKKKHPSSDTLTSATNG